MGQFLTNRLLPGGLAEVAEYTVVFAVGLTTLLGLLSILGIM